MSVVVRSMVEQHSARLPGPLRLFRPAGNRRGVASLLISITLLACAPIFLRAQGEPSSPPPPQAPGHPPDPARSLSSPAGLATIPHATPLPPAVPPELLTMDSDTFSRHDDLYLRSGDVVIRYGDHLLHADAITYNDATGELTLTGHVRLEGGQNDESLQASHGTYNLNTGTGTFYDVSGSVGLHEGAGATPIATPVSVTTPIAGNRVPRLGYTTPNPFLFQGRRVDKTGPADYVVYDGSVTSCLLPHPDWQLYAHRFTLTQGVARAANSNFRLLGVPVLFLPLVTHPVDASQRQSGLLIPVVGYSSASNNTGSKGLTLGEQIYLTLGRSADLTVGTLYYSLRGFSENGTFRYRGPGDDFFTTRINALQDRGFTAPAVNAAGKSINLYTNQGGQDVTVSFRRQLAPNTRVVADTEYLSSYVFREAFTESFNQAVSTDILSNVFVTRQQRGYSLDARFDRYEGLKVVPVLNHPGEEVKIYHAPALDLTGVDHRLPGTPLLFSINASAAGLKRIQPNFVSSGIIERFDLRPELSLPLGFAGWRTLSSVAFDETVYSRGRRVPYNNNGTNGANTPPIETTDPVNRAALDLKVDIRPPVIERTFAIPRAAQRLFGDAVRHTVEANITYRDTSGVSNFLNILRFDDLDLLSDTNELNYGVTQHLYFQPHIRPARSQPGCPATPRPVANPLAAATSSETPRPVATPSVPRENDTPDDADDTPAAPGAPDTLDPTPRASNDGNGIPNASAAAPDLPTRTHAHIAKDLCAPPPAPPRQQALFSWQLAQTHYFDQTFGGAVIKNRRNLFDTTLSLSGIAFLTEPRSISPLLSRMRVRTSSHADLEYDFDYDTGATKFTSQNVLLDVHEGQVFGGFSYARLNAPGRNYTENISIVTNTAVSLTANAVSDFSQMRLLLGYGTPSKPGFSAAGSAGLDLNLGNEQYVTVQTSYNWNCCGLSVEYRKYDLGTIRNEGAYRFNFTLANIGSAGNLRRSEALF